MSRAKIGVVVALVVAGLTGTAYILTTSSLETKIKADMVKQVARSRDLLEKNASFDALDLIKRAESYARDKRFADALAKPDPAAQKDEASQGLMQAMVDLGKRREKQEENRKEPKPDFIALVNAQGQMVGIDPDGEFPDRDWKKLYPAVSKALDPPNKEFRTFKDIWDFDNSLVDVGVAPIIDQTTGELRGAVVVAYTLDVKDAEAQEALLGAEVAYFDTKKIRGTSFGGSDETGVRDLLFDKGKLAEQVLTGDKSYSDVVAVKIDGKTYLASATAMPMNVSGRPAGAVVLTSLSEVLAPVSSVKLTILLLGLGALVIAILAMLFTARVILTPAEEIELGVTEIINGNIDYTFKPVGADFDGLANALNVMLARLLGRPEPGDEEYDEEGNIATGSSKVLLDEGEAPTAAALGGATAPDAETLALAQEPEADYYKRIYNEFVAARKALGENVDGVTYDGFAAKLRLNEGKLKKKYSCRAVRFRVQSKDGQVTLKPVPIV